MKGIILAGGAGSRLFPLTQVSSKQLQPVYDKPMIYYPLSLLMLGGIREILMITTPHDQPQFKRLLGDGSQLGLKIEYCIQEKPTGLPEAFVLGSSFIGDSPVTLILGDNLFYGDIAFFRNAISEKMKNPKKEEAFIFAYPVKDPERYGVVEFKKETYEVVGIEEKPTHPKSRYAIPGLYIFDGSVSTKVKSIKPSPRGETEIVDLLKSYLIKKSLFTEVITRGVAWLDTGTPQALMEASNFIAAVEQRQGLKIACLEEISLRMGFVSSEAYQRHVKTLPNCEYKNYLNEVFEEITV
jgi:glucose-1-phosphate thymidylyltransferase